MEAQILHLVVFAARFYLKYDKNQQKVHSHTKYRLKVRVILLRNSNIGQRRTIKQPTSDSTRTHIRCVIFLTHTVHACFHASPTSAQAVRLPNPAFKSGEPGCRNHLINIETWQCHNSSLSKTVWISIILLLDRKQTCFANSTLFFPAPCLPNSFVF